MDLAKKVIDVAIAEGFGPKEVAYEGYKKGSNWGPQVKKYLNFAKIFSSAPWCCAFSLWCANEACKAYGLDFPLPITGYTPDIYFFATDNGILFNSPQPGDLVIFDDGRWIPYPYYHIGIVEKYSGGSTVNTIEGNTSGSSTDEGDGQYRKVRDISAYGLHFVRWINLIKKEDKLIPLIDLDPVSAYETKLTDCLVIDGKSYAPVRELLEKLNYDVSFNKKENKIFIIERTK